MSGDDTGFLGRMRDKLIARKQQWARDGRLLTGTKPAARERLPPGQHLARNWPVLDLGEQPDVPLERWRLTMTGLVEQPVQWDWDDFLAQPQRRMRSDIHCVTAWSRYDNEWSGVTAQQVLSVAKPKPEATHVLFHAYDGYTTNVPLPYFAAPDALLAHSWMGEALSREHGGPVRVVIPKLFFWKSAKWLKQIEFVAGDRPGFWEVRGYHMLGDPWREQRYAEGRDHEPG